MGPLPSWAPLPMLSPTGAHVGSHSHFLLQRGAFYRAMGLLTVASPCALVMVPLAYVSAIAAIASRSAASPLFQPFGDSLQLG